MAVKLAQIIQPSQQISDGDSFGGELGDALSVPLPPELEGKNVNILDTMDTNPTVKFEETGEYVVGRYTGMRELNIEGRTQRLYDIKIPAGDIVSCWGSTVLDARMDAAGRKGLTIGSSIMIQYLGDVDTGKGNPARNFRVAWK